MTAYALLLHAIDIIVALCVCWCLLRGDQE